MIIDQKPWPWAPVDKCCWHSHCSVGAWAKNLVDSIRPLITGFLASTCYNPSHWGLRPAGKCTWNKQKWPFCCRLDFCWSEERFFSWNFQVEKGKASAGVSTAVEETHLSQAKPSPLGVLKAPKPKKICCAGSFRFVERISKTLQFKSGIEGQKSWVPSGHTCVVCCRNLISLKI